MSQKNQQVQVSPVLMKLHVIHTYWGVEDGAVHSEPWHQVEVECSVPRPARFRREDAVDSHWIAVVPARPLGPLCCIPLTPEIWRKIKISE